jgi:MinD superfamily P-loop ATPase
VIGVVENMKMQPSDNVERETEKLGIAFLGAIPYDSSVEQAMGNVQKLLETAIAQRIKEILSNKRL